MSSSQDDHSADGVAKVRDLVRAVAAGGDFGGAVAELFAHGFRSLESCISVDVAVVVMIEHHLEVYISSRADVARSLEGDLGKCIRDGLAAHVSTSLASAELVVASERHDLPAGGGGLDHLAAALLHQERRVAGLLLLFRGAEPFSELEQQVVEIFSVQVSQLLVSGRTRARIIDLAETDELTGVGNKRKLWRELAREIERARAFQHPLSLMLFDIDDFKAINDSFGHVAGDAVISELCAAVKGTLRDIDSMARFGGDEFAIILPNTDLTGACSVAERIMYVVGALSIPADEVASIQCSISIGIASYTSADTSATEFLRRADENLYVSKRTGKNRYTA